MRPNPNPAGSLTPSSLTASSLGRKVHAGFPDLHREKSTHLNSCHKRRPLQPDAGERKSLRVNGRVHVAVRTKRFPGGSERSAPGSATQSAQAFGATLGVGPDWVGDAYRAREAPARPARRRDATHADFPRRAAPPPHPTPAKEMRTREHGT